MAKRPQKKARVQKVNKQPRSRALPGMEDHAIKALDDVAADYAEIRDSRMELTKQETQLKASAMKLMRKYQKTTYKHNGIEIRIVPGEDDIKVKIKPVTEEGAELDEIDADDPSPADDVEITAETLGDA